MPHHKLLYRVAYSMLGNAQDAEDLLQDFYLKLWTKRDELPEEAKNQAYLVTSIRNLYYEKRRLKRIDASAELGQQPEPPDSSPPLERQIESRDEARHMQVLINDLPDRDRQVLERRLVEDQSYEEIERDTGLSQGNIRQIVLRTRMKLKQQFEIITKTWRN